MTDSDLLNLYQQGFQSSHLAGLQAIQSAVLAEASQSTSTQEIATHEQSEPQS